MTNGDGASASLTVGTAGHIDHGKTALVRALTGRDTDRLAEEQRRGMSIELGYAELELDGRRLSLVDVPGHERFVRTMIAGASGIDLFLLVVAADDGVMPQTREHLAVLRALGVGDGIVALTKSDLVDEGRREAVAAEMRELLPGTEIVQVSSRTGEGIEALRLGLGRLSERLDAERAAEDVEDVGDTVVLHVDRVFTVAGHGTVVTGTLWSGRIARGDRVLVLPGGKEARVRSIESHDRSLEVVGPRRRVALNLGGLGRDEVERGDVITLPGTDLRPTYRLDVELAAGAGEVAGELRVQVHHGTRESPARVIDLGEGVVQLRLEQPLLARRGDHVVIRRIAPPDTLGGAVILDPSPRRHGRAAHSGPPGASMCGAPEDGAVTGTNGTHGASALDGRRPGELEAAAEPAGRGSMELERDGTKFGTAAEPAGRGSAEIEEDRPRTLTDLARRVLAELEGDGERPRTPAKLAEDLGLDRREVEGAIGELVEARAVVRFKADVVYPIAEAERLSAAATALALANGSTSIAEVRDALGLSRKYVQALLEHLDGERVLRRDGDRHLPRRTAP